MRTGNDGCGSARRVRSRPGGPRDFGVGFTVMGLVAAIGAGLASAAMVAMVPWLATR
jgi:hypothetical protein